MKDDLIRRQTAITAIQKAYADTEGGADRCAVWKNVGLTNALHIMQDLPSAQPEHLVKESGNLVKGLVNDCISRQAAKDALAKFVPYAICDESTESYTNGLTDAYNLICQLPSAQPERMTNRQWIDFLSAQFDISRTSAKEMLHGMMRWKKEDNFKKMFNGGKT